MVVSASMSAVTKKSVSVSAFVSAITIFLMSVSASVSADRGGHGCPRTRVSVSTDLCSVNHAESANIKILVLFPWSSIWIFLLKF